MDSAVLRLIPEFSGAPESSAVSEWLEKVELVCSLRGVTELQEVIPLRLTDGAFAVYQQLSDAEKKDAKHIKEALTTAFGIDAFSAYEEFAARRIKPGETVDVYMAALKKLANAFGGVPNKALCCAFVAGLPDSTRHTLRAASRMETLTLEQLVARARTIMTEEPSVVCAGQAARRGDRKSTAVNSGRYSCFECGGPNHLARDCLQRRRNSHRNRERPPRASKGACFNCGNHGHHASTCPGNEEGEERHARASSPELQ